MEILAKENQVKYVPYLKSNGKYVLVDKDNTSIIITKNREYDDISFSHDLFSVTINGKYGFLDLEGKEFVPPVYDYAQYWPILSDTHIVLKKYLKEGVINKKGEIIVPIIYDSVLFDEKGIIVWLNNKWGFIDYNGKVLIDPFFEEIDHRQMDWFFFDFKNGCIPAKKDKKCGFIDENGNIVIAFVYDEVGHFCKGLARVKQNGNWGYINSAGIITIPLVFENAYDFLNGCAAIKQNNKWGFINECGDFIIKPKYSKVNSFLSSHTVVELDYKCGVIDIAGNETVECIYDYISPTFYSSEKIRAAINGKWGFIDKTGNILIPFRFDHAEEFKNGLAKVKFNDKFGYINDNGSLVIPAKYSYAQSFDEKVAKVQLNNKWGIIDIFGFEIIEIKYDDILSEFQNGHFFVKLNEKWGLYDIAGKELFSPKFEKVYGDFFYGFTRVQFEGNEFYIDIIGNQYRDKLTY